MAVEEVSACETPQESLSTCDQSAHCSIYKAMVSIDAVTSLRYRCSLLEEKVNQQRRTT